MVDALRSVFAHISSTVFFEYRTINALVDHFIATEEDAVRRWVGGTQPEPLQSPASTDQSLNRLNAQSTGQPASRRRRNRRVSIADSESRRSQTASLAIHAQD